MHISRMKSLKGIPGQKTGKADFKGIPAQKTGKADFKRIPGQKDREGRFTPRSTRTGYEL